MMKNMTKKQLINLLTKRQEGFEAAESHNRHIAVKIEFLEDQVKKNDSTITKLSKALEEKTDDFLESRQAGQLMGNEIERLQETIHGFTQMAEALNA